MAFSNKDFEVLLRDIFGREEIRAVAAAVSGGPDSMALVHLLWHWAKPLGVRVKAYTVDHGLRPESLSEAIQVGDWVRHTLPGIEHEILTWTGEKPQKRIMEEARAARYELLQEAMKRDALKHLFVAHHQDDQAETFLFRLAKGSGLDGLAAMRLRQDMDRGQVIVRPLLNVSKADLVALCDQNSIPYIRDPSNESPEYARPRLRAMQTLLADEGLSPKRLATTAKRLMRARDALEKLSRVMFNNCILQRREKGFLFEYDMLRDTHEELSLRVILQAMHELRPEADYAPRLEKAEALLERLLHDPAFNGATLGGCAFALDRKNGTVWIGKEE